MCRSGAMKRLNVLLSASPAWVLKNFNSPASCECMSIASILPRNRRARTFTWTRKFEREATHRLLSSESPPPGTIIFAHNTLSADSTDVQVFYPFHPLHGVTLRILRRPKRGDGAVCVMDPAGRRLKIPTWMLLPECSEITISQQPRLGKQALLSLASLIASQLDSPCPR